MNRGILSALTKSPICIRTLFYREKLWEGRTEEAAPLFLEAKDFLAQRIGESYSSGRLYDKIGDAVEGKVMYVLPKGVLGYVEVEEE